MSDQYFIIADLEFPAQAIGGWLDGPAREGTLAELLDNAEGDLLARIANPTTVAPDPPAPVDPCTMTLDAGTDSGDP